MNLAQTDSGGVETIVNVGEETSVFAGLTLLVVFIFVLAAMCILFAILYVLRKRYLPHDKDEEIHLP